LSVYDLFEYYIVPEILERLCEKCQCKTAISEKKLHSLPRILVIHLKRFQQSSDGSFIKKLQDKISINSKLVLPQQSVVQKGLLEPVYFRKDTELSEELRKPIPTDNIIEEEDDDIKRAMAESVLTGLSEEQQLQMALANSEKEYYNTLTRFDMTKKTMELSESKDPKDYGSDTESIDEDDPIKKEFEQLNLPIYGDKSRPPDEPALPHTDEIQLLNRPLYNITDEMSPDLLEYHLQGIVRHKGESVGSGHYVANILDEKDQWNCFDDSVVSQISDDQAIKGITEQEAYILFYVHSSLFQKLV